MTGTRRRIVVDDSVLAGRIGERIRAARLGAGLTQQQLAQGRYTKAYISALEKGHAKPSMAALNFIANRLGLPAARFLSDETSRWSRMEADLLLASGRWAEATQAFDDLLRVSLDRGSRAEALRGRAEALCRMEEGQAAIGPGMEAAELFGELSRPRDRALAVYWLAYAQHLAGNSAEARSLLTSVLEDERGPHGASDPDLRMRVLMALGSISAAMEDHRASLAYLEEARVLAADLDDLRRAAFLSLLATSYAETGDTEGAIRSAIESLALFRGADAQREAAILENNLAVAYLRVGNISRASELAADARIRHQIDGDRRSLAHVVETEAQIALAQGAFVEAETLATEASDHARASSNARALASALLTIARAQNASHRPDAALASFERATAELRVHGPATRLQAALAEWADLLASLGRHVEAYDLTREALRATAPMPPPVTLPRMDTDVPATAADVGKPTMATLAPRPKAARTF